MIKDREITQARPVTPGVAGSSPVRSATNLKGLPKWEGLFAMGGFCQLTPMFAHQSPVSRPGFGIFSKSETQIVAFARGKGAGRHVIPLFGCAITVILVLFTTIFAELLVATRRFHSDLVPQGSSILTTPSSIWTSILKPSRLARLTMPRLLGMVMPDNWPIPCSLA